MYFYEAIALISLAVCDNYNCIPLTKRIWLIVLPADYLVPNRIFNIVLPFSGTTSRKYTDKYLLVQISIVIIT